ncbi:MAG: hypothetical protein R2755_32945 [Acidimicrobiales bacterium]
MLALDRDMTATDLVHERVTGLAGGTTIERGPGLPPREQPLSQFPITLTRQEREAPEPLQEEGMSGAQLASAGLPTDFVPANLFSPQQAGGQRASSAVE